MATKPRRRDRRRGRAEWQELIEQWRGSGQSLRGFCAEQGLHAPTLSWWRWRLGRGEGPVRSWPPGRGRRSRSPVGAGPGVGCAQEPGRWLHLVAPWPQGPSEEMPGFELCCPMAGRCASRRTSTPGPWSGCCRCSESGHADAAGRATGVDLPGSRGHAALLRRPGVAGARGSGRGPAVGGSVRLLQPAAGPHEAAFVGRHGVLDLVQAAGGRTVRGARDELGDGGRAGAGARRPRPDAGSAAALVASPGSLVGLATETFS